MEDSLGIDEDNLGHAYRRLIDSEVDVASLARRRLLNELYSYQRTENETFNAF